MNYGTSILLMDQDGWRVSGGEPGVNPRGGIFGAQGYGGGLFDGNTSLGKTPCGGCGALGNDAEDACKAKCLGNAQCIANCEMQYGLKGYAVFVSIGAIAGAVLGIGIASARKGPMDKGDALIGAGAGAAVGALAAAMIKNLIRGGI